MRNREIERVPFRSALTKYRNIENRNKAFNKLTKKAKRREIAFDALKLVMGREVKASIGCYWGWSLKEIKSKSHTSKDLQENLLNLPKNDSSCTVCQRGLMMVSQIRLSNNLDPYTCDVEKGSERIIKGFSYEAFTEMEAEYERNSYAHPYFTNTNKKLANICCNVIANGDFKTADKTDYLTKWKLTIKG